MVTSWYLQQRGKTYGKAQWTKVMNHCLRRDIKNKRCPKRMGKGLLSQDNYVLVQKKLGSAMGATKSPVDTDLTKDAQRGGAQFPTSADGSKAR